MHVNITPEDPEDILIERMKTRIRCRSSDTIAGHFREFLFSDYDEPDDCLRVAKAFRNKAEALVNKMK